MRTGADDNSPRAERPLWIDVLIRLAVSATIVAVVTHVLVRPFAIPSASMEPTLMTGDRVVAKVWPGADEVGRGDVVVFGHGETWDDDRLDDDGNLLTTVVRTGGDILGFGPSHQSHTVKRVVGLPGERVECCDTEGRVTVDGEPLDEPYLEPARDLPFDPAVGCDGTAPSPRCFPEVTVPAGSLLVLGDNRANSSDSVTACRVAGADGTSCARLVPEERVVGQLGWRVWPMPPGGID